MALVFSTLRFSKSENYPPPPLIVTSSVTSSVNTTAVSSIVPTNMVSITMSILANIVRSYMRRVPIIAGTITISCLWWVMRIGTRHSIDVVYSKEFLRSLDFVLSLDLSLARYASHGTLLAVWSALRSLIHRIPCKMQFDLLSKFIAGRRSLYAMVNVIYTSECMSILVNCAGCRATGLAPMWNFTAAKYLLVIKVLASGHFANV
ncbi:hypothetical protein DFH11DRAFT_1622633 [Phellopilus nigrolimitatus]|nr:hypothetical protein DFH11DRAFT_1622633 [Phellopilus nigrolimitatus]